MIQGNHRSRRASADEQKWVLGGGARIGIYVGSDRAEPGLWDTLAAVHGQDAYYDTVGLVAGADSLGSGERAGLLAALGRDDDLAGLSILHVQCHIGFDTVSLARRGAQVTGTDFSAASLAKAADIAARSGSASTGSRPSRRRSPDRCTVVSTWYTRLLVSSVGSAMCRPG